MVRQVSYSIYSKIWEEDSILPIEERYTENNKNLCKWKGIEIVEGHIMSDHVHLYYQYHQSIAYLKLLGI